MKEPRMARYDKQTLYLVQSVNWHQAEEYEFADEDEADVFVCPDLSQGRPLLAFTTREAAQADAQRREAWERTGRNPFAFGETLAERTTMPEGVFRDFLTDLGLTPPPPRREEADWAGWWERNAPTMTQHQRQAVWDVLDRVRFYTVAALEPPGK
jgi:hypothetical protein